MLRAESKTRRILRYITATALILAFALSFFSCIRETFVAWFPERLDILDGTVEYLPMLPGFVRYLLIPAAALLLIGKVWTDILSLVALVLPLIGALAMEFIYVLFEPMGGLGGYVYTYTILGWIVTGCIFLGFAGVICLLCTCKSKWKDRTQ